MKPNENYANILRSERVCVFLQAARLVVALREGVEASSISHDLTAVVLLSVKSITSLSLSRRSALSIRSISSFWHRQSFLEEVIHFITSLYCQKVLWISLS